MESYIQVSGGNMFLRYNRIDTNKETILLIHGLGESGLCFSEIFDFPEFEDFNIIIPDMIGFGKSTEADNEDYSFDEQVNRMWELIENIGIRHFYLVGHSVGGDIGILMCESPDKHSMIKKFVNIESDITQYDAFITKEGKKAEENGNFRAWFIQEFCVKTVLNQWAPNSISCQRYYQSLQLCSMKAFQSKTLELYDLKNAMPGENTCVFGFKYVNIQIPKIFCYGSQGSDKKTIQFLQQNNQEVIEFKNAGHWVMIDAALEFYPFLYHFITKDAIASSIE